MATVLLWQLDRIVVDRKSQFAYTAIPMQKRFSIIIPVLHEAAIIHDLIGHLEHLEGAGEAEVIIVDGSATGDTMHAITTENVLCLSSPPGRARQMNHGAAAASGDILIFLHADTRLPADALTLIGRTLADATIVAGAFDLRIHSDRWIYRLIAAAASLRSRITRIPYGDQAIFIRRESFFHLGGYPDIPLMEDVAFMRQIKKAGKITILPRPVVTSPRRWEREDIIATTLKNWFLLAAYYLGVHPEKLARYCRKENEHRDT